MSRELLPWYVNGTLDARESAEVERTLAESPEAREDLELWRAVAAGAHATAGGAEAVELGWKRLQRELRARPVPRRMPRWGMAAAAALVALLCAQTLYLTKLQRAHDEQIRQLSSEPPGLGAEEWRVQVRFRAAATAAEITTLLLAIDARVIAGPSALGIYELAVPRNSRFADAEAVASWLSEQAIVEQGTAPP